MKPKQANLTFAPHPGQEEISSAILESPRVVVRAGRKFGKSALALNITLREALHNPGRYWIVAPEYRQAKSIYWMDLVREYIPQDLIVKKNDVELYVEIMTLTAGKTSIIEFKGSDREDKLRGPNLRGVVLDEFAFQKDHIWDKIISPMLIQTSGWALFITTPNGVANHFKKFWDNALAWETDNPKEWRTFHFTSYDNPLIPKVNIDKERDRLTEEFFSQEYMADFAKFTGIIFTEFDDKVHVQSFEVDESWSFYCSVDFGATDPNAASFIGVDKDDVLYLFDEIYIADLETSELAELIKQKQAHRHFVATYADAAAKQSRIDLATFGVHAIPAAKHPGEGRRQAITAGIHKIQQRLKDRKIVIHPRCKATIKEFMSYSWRKDRLGEAVNLPEDKNNHIIDELRYFIYTYKGGEHYETINYLPRGIVDPVVGY